MHCRFSFSQLPDPILPHTLASAVARDRSTIAEILGLITEVDARKLYLPAGYPSMFAYCVGELRLSEDAAAKRIQAARVARRFPAVFEAVAAGRLYLTAVGLLAPHLAEDTADELLAAATHKTKSEIERLLAERFPRPDVLAWVEAIPPSPLARSSEQYAPAHVEGPQAPPMKTGPVGERSRVKPLSPQSFAVQFTLSQRGHDQLCYAQELLGHQIPSGEIAQVFERALDALIPQLEQRKFAATARPRPGRRRPTRSPRHIPAQVKRTVWVRDGGQCTFVSEAGRRCPARKCLEFDHIDEVARGGEATVAGIRLLCRADNEFAAECTFGSEFMRHKRIAAAEARAEAKERAAAARVQAAAADQASGEGEDRDVVPWLRQLGFNASEAHRAAALCKDIPDASLEQRLRVALSCFGKRSTRVGRAGEGRETAAALAGATSGGDGP
jgi:hypothetical protein